MNSALQPVIVDHFRKAQQAFLNREFAAMML